MPGLQQLFGELAQLVGVCRAIDDTVEALNLELLAEREFDRGSHEPMRIHVRKVSA
mgnify:CR=1 FL=1